VLSFLRYMGILTAAAWFGTSVLFLFAVEPAFSSESMHRLLPESHAVAVSHLVGDRFWTAQYLCGFVALLHMIGEKLYTGRPFQRSSLVLNAALLALALMSATLFQARLKQYHMDVYGTRSTPQQRVHGQRWLGIWNGLSVGIQIVMTVGLAFHLSQTVSSDASYRFVMGGKNRG
jgi:hypothetical protein